MRMTAQNSPLKQPEPQRQRPVRGALTKWLRLKRTSIMTNVISMPKPAGKRWRVDIGYRHEGGVQVQTFFVEELEELHDRVEAGPDWNAITGILVALAERSAPDGWTVEQSLAS